VGAVLTKNGKGKALLCSVHFEYPLTDPPARDAIAKLERPPSQETLDESERSRIRWAEGILRLLGLEPPGKRKDTGDGSIAVGDEDPSLLLHPTHPSPIFVFTHPDLSAISESTFAAEAIQGKLQDGPSQAKVLKDSNDEIHLTILGSTHDLSTADDVVAYLANKRRDAPVAEAEMGKLSLQDGSAAAQLPQAPDFHALSKSILLPAQSIPYTPRWTPLFNFETYWASLDTARSGSGRKSGVLRRDSKGIEKPALGDLLFYAETVTSTQTMLDR
jgi:biotin--protein ligase